MSIRYLWCLVYLWYLLWYLWYPWYIWGKIPQTAIFNMPLNIYRTNNKTKLVVKKKLTEKNPVETHEGGLGQDGLENKQKVEE